MNQTIKGKIGFGTAPLGNMFRAIPEEEAQATIKEAWDRGIRYFDTAPLYGAGLSEIRLGEGLSTYKRDEYLLSTKVGRVILDEEEEKTGLYASARKNKVSDDYTADATLRSIEQSLKRLKTDRLDMVYVHDISPDFHGDEWISKFDEARKGAFPVLAQLKEEGVISSWGPGVNTTIPIELAIDLEEFHPDLCLTATQYTLLNHERALERMMPQAAANGVGLVIGAPFNSGALLGGNYYNYQEVTPEMKTRIHEFKEVADQFQVSLKAAALQFSTAHPAVEAVIPGSTRPERIQEDLDGLQASIPTEFWQTLVEKGFISAKAPLPRCL